jgi:hypothetical protein
MERNPKLVRSITSFPISSTHSDVELVLEQQTEPFSSSEVRPLAAASAV